MALRSVRSFLAPFTLVLVGLAMCTVASAPRAAAPDPGLERARRAPASRHSLWDLINRRTYDASRTTRSAPASPNTIEDGTWTPMFIPGRSGHSAVYDPVRDRMLVFGGDDGWTFSSDVWQLTFSGAPAWKNISPDGATPSGRTVHLSVYDPARDQMIVFGGWDAGARHDVWTLSLAGTPQWTELTPAGTPPPVGFLDAGVYDPVRDRLIVFDGTGAGWTNAVWALSLSGTPVWTQVPTTGTPPVARTGMSVVYDPVRDRVVMFGGDDGGYPNRNDTWTLSLDGPLEWTQLSPAGQLPPGRSAHTAIYDAIGDRMVICGGTDQYVFTSDVWALPFSGALAWTPLVPSDGPPGRAFFSAVFDSQRDRLVIFAGMDDVYFPDLNDAWALPLSGPSAWTPIPGAFPGVRSGHTMIRDGANDRALVFGGYTWPPKYYQDVWSLPLSGGAPWQQVAPSGPGPSGRYQHSAIHDSQRNRMVIFGGTGWSGPGNDVWALSLSGVPAWTELAPGGTPPPPRFGHAAIYDASRDRMVVFGGENDNSVWTLTFRPAPYWTQASPAGTPPAVRRGHSAIYDAKRDRMVIFGGGGTGEVWQLSLAAGMKWTELMPAGPAPGGRSDHAAVYDSVRDRMVIFGGYVSTDNIESNDTWALALDGSPEWTKLMPARWPPEVREDPAAVYDPTRDCMAVFGGGDFYVDFNDAWMLVWGAPTATSHGSRFADALRPCYPNPFNPRVTIPFELRKDGRATLAVYDVSGHLVRTLFNEWTTRGTHAASWDGSSDAGQHLSSGVYFCRLQADGFSATRKVILLK